MSNGNQQSGVKMSSVELHKAKSIALLTAASGLSTLTTSACLSLALGHGWQEFGKLAVIISGNVFSLPLLFTGLFNYPSWVWYIVVLSWIISAYQGVKFYPE